MDTHFHVYVSHPDGVGPYGSTRLDVPLYDVVVTDHRHAYHIFKSVFLSMHTSQYGEPPEVGFDWDVISDEWDKTALCVDGTRRLYMPVQATGYAWNMARCEPYHEDCKLWSLN